jgi:hypothetical protein
MIKRNNNSTSSSKNPVINKNFGAKMSNWNFVLTREQLFILQCPLCHNKERFSSIKYLNQLVWVCDQCGNQTQLEGTTFELNKLLN